MAVLSVNDDIYKKETFGLSLRNTVVETCLVFINKINNVMSYKTKHYLISTCEVTLFTCVLVLVISSLFDIL